MTPSGFAAAVRRRVLRAWRSTRLRTQDPMDLLARRGLFDVEYYRAQFAPHERAPRTLAEAVAHYREHGREADLAFHPFYEPEWWGGRAEEGRERKHEVETLLAMGNLWLGSPSPLLADTGGEVGEMGAFLVDVTNGRRPTGLGEGWGAARTRRSMIDAVRRGHHAPVNTGSSSGADWQRLAQAGSGRAAGRVSVIVATFEDWRMTVDAVRTALRHAHGADIEVLVVDNGSRPAVFRLLTAVFLTEDRVTVLRSTVNTNFSGAMNIGIAHSTGEYVLLLNNDAMLGPGWWAPLRDALQDERVVGVQPLILYPGQRRIQAAGTMFLGEGTLPWHFLAGHPVEDARLLPDATFRAVTAAVVLLRAVDLIGEEGFDEAYRNGYEDVDLCLRLTGSGRHFVVAVESTAEHPEGSTEGRSRYDSENRRRFLSAWAGRMPAPEAHRYEEVGLRLVGMRPWAYALDVPIALDHPHIVRPPRDARDGRGLPSLRWSLCVVDGDADDIDTLRADLHALGQEVVTFTGGSSAADALDDVLVSFLPGTPFTPRSATTNVLVSGTVFDPPAGWDAVLGACSTEWSYRADDAQTDRLRVLARLVEHATLQRERRFGPVRSA